MLYRIFSSNTHLHGDSQKWSQELKVQFFIIYFYLLNCFLLYSHFYYCFAFLLYRIFLIFIIWFYRRDFSSTWCCQFDINEKMGPSSSYSFICPTSSSWIFTLIHGHIRMTKIKCQYFSLMPRKIMRNLRIYLEVCGPLDMLA